MLQFLIFCCLFLSVLRPVLVAQDKEESISARFTVYSLKRLEGIRFFDGEESREIEFYSSSRSPVYKYEGTGVIYFYRENQLRSLDNEGFVQRELVGQVRVPESGGDFLLVFFKDPDSEKEAYQIYAMPDSRSDLPSGTIRIFNATQWNLLGVVGSEKIAVKPGPSRAIRVGNGSFKVGLAFQENGTLHRGFNSPMKLESGGRGVLFVYPPFVKGSAVLQVRFLNQMLPKELEDDGVEVNVD